MNTGLLPAPSYMAVINRYDYAELFTHYECFLFMINWWTDVPWSRVSFQLLILVNENVVRNSVSIVCHFFVFITFWHHLWSITEQTYGNIKSEFVRLLALDIYFPNSNNLQENLDKLAGPIQETDKFLVRSLWHTLLFPGCLCWRGRFRLLLEW